MKKFILGFLLILGSMFAKGTIINRKFTLQFYGTYNVVIYTPDNITKDLPAFIFVPGSGESNGDPNALYINGPLHFIQQGWKPNFIVVGIQPLNGGPGPDTFIGNALDSLFNPIYHIDQTKWYLTGLSYGAATIFVYIQGFPDAGFRSPTATIPMSYALITNCGDFYTGTDALCGTDLRYKNIPSWGFCGDQDGFHDKMARYFQLMQQLGYVAPFITLVGEGHCCWNTRYDPNYKMNGLSIYDWALQFPISSLPLTGFTLAGKTSNGSTMLNWSTLTEANNNKFIIERSVDSGKTFKQIGVVKSKATSGNSTSPIQYTFQVP